MEGGFKTLALLSVTSSSAVPCGLRSVLVALRLVLLVVQPFFYVPDVLFMHIMQVLQVQVVFLTCFPSSWYRSWKRRS